MRSTLLVFLLTLALPLTGCSKVNDLVQSVTGGGASAEGSGATAASGTSDEGSGATATPGTSGEGAPPPPDDGDPVVTTSASGMPVVEGRAMAGAFAHIPAGPTAVFSLDAAAIWALYDSVYSEFAAFMEPADMDTLFARLLAESDVPESIAQAIRITELRDLVIAVWVDEESALLVANVEAFNDAPEDGADAATFFEPPAQIARRGDHVLIGFGAGFTNALADGERFSPSEWQAGWDALPDNPAAMLFVPTLGEDPAAVLREFDLPEDFAFTRAAAGFRTDGALGLALEIDDDTLIRQGLGALALGTEQFIDEVREAVPPAYAGWANYLDLARRTLLSQLRYDRQGTVSSLSVPAAACGVQLALPVVLGASYFALEQGPNGPPEDLPLWTNVEVATADGCGPLAGPAPAIPRSLARLAPVETSGGMMVFWDLGGALRGALPTMGNLLPVAMDHAAIRAALGDAPLGLAGLDDAEGSGALFVQLDDTTGDGSAVLVAHRGLQSMVPTPPETTAEVRDGLGYVIASPEQVARLDGALDPTAPWPRAVNALPAQTLLAFGADGTMARRAGGLPVPAVQAVIDATQVAVVGVTADYSVAARILVNGDAAALSAALEPGLRAFAEQMAASIPESEREMMEPVIDMYVSMFAFGHEGDDIVTIGLNIPADSVLVRQSMMTGVGAAIMIPAMLSYQQRVAFEQEAVAEVAMIYGPPAEQLERIRQQAHTYYLTERLDADGKALPMQFPESVTFAPSLEQMRDACATAGNAFVANSDMMMYAAEGWRQLGVASYAPGSDTAISFTSEGAGPNATYTITVRADTDCDGVYSMFRSTGSVVDGVPVAGPVTETQPDE